MAPVLSLHSDSIEDPPVPCSPNHSVCLRLCRSHLKTRRGGESEEERKKEKESEEGVMEEGMEEREEKKGRREGERERGRITQCKFDFRKEMQERRMNQQLECSSTPNRASVNTHNHLSPKAVHCFEPPFMQNR